MAKSRGQQRQNHGQRKQGIVTAQGMTVRFEGSALVVDSKGWEQSWSDGKRPDLLEFEYMQHMDLFMQAAHPTSIRDRVFHAGAGACALAKAWASTRRESTHLAVDTDPELVEFLKAIGWIGPKSRIKVRHADARDALAGSGATYDVIVRDAFADDHTPRPLTTLEWARLAKSRLRPGGLYLANVGHGPQASGKADVAAAMETFTNIAVIADPKVWKSARHGNLVVAGWEGYDLDWDRLNRGIRMLPLAASMFVQSQVKRWLGGQAPASD